MHGRVGKIPSPPRPTLTCPSRLIDRRFQVRPWCKSRHTPRGNLHVASISGIPHASGLTFQHRESSETRDGDPVTALQAGLNPRDAGLQGTRRLVPRKLCLHCDPAYQIFLGHDARE